MNDNFVICPMCKLPVEKGIVWEHDSACRARQNGEVIDPPLSKASYDAMFCWVLKDLLGCSLAKAEDLLTRWLTVAP